MYINLTQLVSFSSIFHLSRSYPLRTIRNDTSVRLYLPSSVVPTSQISLKSVRSVMIPYYVFSPVYYRPHFRSLSVLPYPRSRDLSCWSNTFLPLVHKSKSIQPSKLPPFYINDGLRRQESHFTFNSSGQLSLLSTSQPPNSSLLYTLFIEPLSLYYSISINIGS